MDTLRAARYPFIRDASAYAEEKTDSIEELLTGARYSEVRERGLARVIGAMKNHTIPDYSLSTEYNRLVEVLSYPYARMLVSVIGDRLLIKRYALAEAERMNAMLSKDIESIPTLLEELEINATVNRDGTMNLHFADFLRFSYVMKAVEWKLINMNVENGYVRINNDKFIRLLQNAYRLRVEQELPLKVPDELAVHFQHDVGKVNLLLAEAKSRMDPTNGEGMKDEFLPPCIKAIIEMAQAGQNLPHSARFALVTFLHALGLNYQQIVAIFAVSPDFNESVSEYQIKHITGELNGTDGYTPPECGTMKTNGICFNPDPLCERIKHPLNYYRIKSGKRFTPRNEE
ncbi:MAG: DNA primase large subunit PriL [archaeon]|nr:DNA primase large subunit PriL [archaeon]